MTQLEIIGIFREYKIILDKTGCSIKEDYVSSVRLLTKAGLLFLTKEDRIIVYRRLILENSWEQISEALGMRWGSFAKRSERELNVRLRKAIISISVLMENSQQV